MAATLVAAGAVSTGGSGAGVTPAWGSGSNRTLNNLLLLMVASTGSATLPAAISGWTTVVQRAGTSCSASIYAKIAAGADAAPVVPAVASAIHNAQLYEFSGMTYGVVGDRSAGNSATTTSPVVATTAGADSQAGDVVMAAVGALSSSSVVNSIVHAFNNGAIATSTNNSAVSATSHYNHAYGVTTSKAAADSDSVSFTTTSNTGIAVALASFAAIVPISAIQDAFPGTTLDSSKWLTYGTVTVSSGACNLTATTAYSGIYARSQFSLTGSSIIAELTPLPVGNGSFQVALELDINQASGSVGGIGANIGSSGGNLWLTDFYKDTSGTQHSGAGIALPANPCWVRIRESGGTTYWDWSPDGINWTNWNSMADPVAVTALFPQLWAGHYSTETDTVTQVRNVNNPPVAQPLTPTANATTAATAAISLPIPLTPTANDTTAAIALVSAATSVGSVTANNTTAAICSLNALAQLSPVANATTAVSLQVLAGAVVYLSPTANAASQAYVTTVLTGYYIFIYPQAQCRTASLWANIGGQMASRVPLNSLSAGSIVFAGSNAPAVGASVNVFLHGTQTPATVWSAETGTNVIPQPLISDGNGQLPGWVTSKQVLDVVASYGGVPGPSYVETNPIAGTDATGNLTPFPANSSMSALVNELVLMSGTGNTITLPTQPQNGAQVGCSALNGATTVAAGLTDTINQFGVNSSTVSIPAGGSATFEYNSGAWYTIAYVTQAQAGTSVFLTPFGDGSDGSVTFDGVTTVLGMAPSSNVYTLSRDVYAQNVTINAGVTLRNGSGSTQLFRVFVRNLLTVSGTMSSNGTNGGNGVSGTGGVGGAGTAAGIWFNGSGAGGNGGTASPATGAGSVSTSQGGAGGAGGTGSPGAGTAGGSITAATGFTSVREQAALLGDSALLLTGGSGGGGGGGGSATVTGGGGGGGGGLVVVAAQSITVNAGGVISANGGVGGNGFGAGGGGGGGGGGAVHLVYRSITNNGSITANGGAGGTGGTQAGIAGSPGRVIQLSAAAP